MQTLFKKKNMKVKICGIQNFQEAQMAIDAGADALGFHVGLEHGKCPIGPATTAEIIRKLPPFVTAVVVTSENDPKRLLHLLRQTGTSVLQLYGASNDVIDSVKGLCTYVKVIVPVTADEDAFEKVKALEGVADAILLDSPKGIDGAEGGTGKTHDWSTSAQIVKESKVPIILAGGLNPENVAKAISIVKSYGVDVRSGVSNPNGSKNISKIHAFIQATRSTE